MCPLQAPRNLEELPRLYVRTILGWIGVRELGDGEGRRSRVGGRRGVGG